MRVGYQVLVARATIFVGAVLATGAQVVATGGSDATPEIALREVLVIGGVGRYARSPVHTDALEALLVAGRWTPPQAGQTLALPDGSTRTWQAVSADAHGLIQHEALRGGYAYAAVEVAGEGAMLLEATSHSLVYVNGEPRAGDPYRTGFVRLPIALRAGSNELLFVCGRGELRARLIAPRLPVFLDVSDATLPDLIVREPADVWAAVVVINARPEALRDARLIARCNGVVTVTTLPAIPPLTVRKVGFAVRAPAPTEPGTREVTLQLASGDGRLTELDRAVLNLRVRRPTESYQRTFVSEIDGSVQYFAVQPRQSGAESDGPPALFLTLHGAGVEALAQADAYTPKDWGYVVAPTNRRPYGFDWEDWGRLDALEVLSLAARELSTDPQRTYLLGHSMGGHGVWHLGATLPDRFAAIAPSAGWISFWSYTGAERLAGDTAMEAVLARASNPSDTLEISRNYLHHGVYVLHGELDDNVPVEQARTMRQHLAGYHADFAYYERPGAGHWWGSACVDWPPLFDFLKSHARPPTAEVQHVEFVTANPAISATCCWVSIEAQKRWSDFSRVDLRVHRDQRLIRGTTDNVARLCVSLQPEQPGADGSPQYLLEPDAPLTVELDGQTLAELPWPADGQLRLGWRAGSWTRLTEVPAGAKGPQRAGPFKEVFRHRVQLVYGTRGSPEDNARAQAKARYDAETFWYRGNGSLDVVADAEFKPDAEPDRSVVLYGNADTNAAWATLFGQSPVQVHSGGVRVGEREIAGDDLAVLAIYPRPGSVQAMVGVVAGTGPAGMRLTERLPYFVSGVAYPDWIVIGPEMLREGVGGVHAAGFYDEQWQLDPAQSAWHDSAAGSSAGSNVAADVSSAEHTDAPA